MNPGVFLLLIALVLAFGIVVLQLMANRPEEGWLPWIRESFTAKDDADLDAEPEDVSLEQLLSVAEEAPEELDFDLLLRR